MVLLSLFLVRLLLFALPVADSFATQRRGAQQSPLSRPLFSSSSPSEQDVQKDEDEVTISQTLVDPPFDGATQTKTTETISSSSTNPSQQPSTSTTISTILDCAVPDENATLKTQLLRLAAAYDRGLGLSSAAARQQAADILDRLEQCASAAPTAAATILLTDSSNSGRITATATNNNKTISLIGTWRLIWTTALDVLSLQASPILTVGAIHQVFESNNSKVVTNVIDLVPRAQSLFPTTMLPSTLLRAKVTTRACEPDNAARHPNRVGLVFERVAVQPLQLLGQDVGGLPPLAVDLPRLPDSWTAASGYFDVTYLDHELLVIRQNAPGGLFALLRVDSLDAA